MAEERDNEYEVTGWAAILIFLCLMPMVMTIPIIVFMILGKLAVYFGIPSIFLSFIFFWFAAIRVGMKLSERDMLYKRKIIITEKQTDEIINYLAAQKRKQAIKVFVNSGECDIYASKLGGEYYGEKVDGLQFLGQINWAEVPHLDGYPQKGLLQFFIDDLNNPAPKYELRYFREIKKTDNKKYKTVKTEQNGSFRSPLNYKEMPLSFARFTDHINFTDDKFDDEFSKITEKVLGEKYNYNDFRRAPSFYGRIEKEFFADLHSKIGGNPMFSQYDAREGGDKRTELIFECIGLEKFDNAESNADTNPTSWGECGIGSFFISKKDLGNLKFDDALYTWDCG